MSAEVEKLAVEKENVEKETKDSKNRILSWLGTGELPNGRAVIMPNTAGRKTAPLGIRTIPPVIMSRAYRRLDSQPYVSQSVNQRV